MLENVNFRLAAESDASQLVDLINSQYSRKKDKPYFYWQYFNSFYPTILMCAFDGTELIGTFGLQKRKLRNGIHVGHAIDLLVSHNWRGRGIFKSLGAKAVSYFNDLDALCVLPNRNGMNACEKAFGWKNLGKINSMSLDKEGFRENISPEFSQDIIPSGEKQDLEMFYYGEETRTWRFKEHSDYEYGYVKMHAGEFAVTKIFTDPGTGMRYGDIVDFECDLNNPGLLRELFLEASCQLKEKKVDMITTWALPHTPLYPVVESLGFIDMPQERYFCLKVLKYEYEYLYDLSRWHLVQADSEIY